MGVKRGEVYISKPRKWQFLDEIRAIQDTNSLDVEKETIVSNQLMPVTDYIQASAYGSSIAGETYTDIITLTTLTTFTKKALVSNISIWFDLRDGAFTYFECHITIYRQGKAIFLIGGSVQKEGTLTINVPANNLVVLPDDELRLYKIRTTANATYIVNVIVNRIELA